MEDNRGTVNQGVNHNNKLEQKGQMEGDSGTVNQGENRNDKPEYKGKTGSHIEMSKPEETGSESIKAQDKGAGISQHQSTISIDGSLPGNQKENSKPEKAGGGNSTAEVKGKTGRQKEKSDSEKTCRDRSTAQLKDLSLHQSTISTGGSQPGKTGSQKERSKPEETGSESITTQDKGAGISQHQSTISIDGSLPGNQKENSKPEKAGGENSTAEVKGEGLSLHHSTISIGGSQPGKRGSQNEKSKSEETCRESSTAQHKDFSPHQSPISTGGSQSGKTGSQKEKSKSEETEKSSRESSTAQLKDFSPHQSPISTGGSQSGKTGSQKEKAKSEETEKSSRESSTAQLKDFSPHQSPISTGGSQSVKPLSQNDKSKPAEQSCIKLKLKPRARKKILNMKKQAEKVAGLKLKKIMLDVRSGNDEEITQESETDENKMGTKDNKSNENEISRKSTAKSDFTWTTKLERILSEGAVWYGFICLLLGIIVALLIMNGFPWSKTDTNATDVGESLAIIRLRMTELESNMQKNLSALRKLELELKDLANKSLLESEMQTVEKRISELNATNTHTLDAVVDRVHQLESFKEELGKSIEEHNKTAQRNHTKMTEDLKDLRKEFKSLEQKVGENMKESVDKLLDQIEKVKKAKQEADDLIAELKKDMERVEPHIFNKEALKIAIGLILVLLFTLAFFVYNLYAKVGGERRVKSSSGVLDQIPRNPTLENKVCMICFKFDKSVEYNNLLSKVCDTPFKQFLVNRHEDLIEIPRCRLYVMFVEFSERHVIIEEPGLALGSLNRCTHDAVAKLGGTLIIIYTHDPGSKNLSEDKRYNKNIYCVSYQPELISLRDGGRFFSIYDRLTQTQIDGLRDRIRQYVR